MAARHETGTADEVYRRLVQEAGLFGQAFFGHRKTRAQARELDRAWRRAQRLAASKVEAEA